jgi:MORN repeat
MPVTKKYKNGEYEGEIVDDRRNGNGVFKYLNGGMNWFSCCIINSLII